MARKSKRSADEEEPAKQSREKPKKQVEEKKEELRKKPSSKREVDLESWIEKNIDEVVSRAGLDYLGINRELWVEVLKDILVELYGSTSSYKSAEDIAKRLTRNSDKVFPVIVARLTNLLENPSADQLEFIVAYVGDPILELAPKIYHWIVRLGRSDLLDSLRYKWGVAWSKTRTPVLPVACPRCGFNSLMPDLVCLICGATVSEKEVKVSTNFCNRLMEVLLSLDCSELGKMLKYDYVLMNDLEIKLPSGNRLPVDIEVFLNKSEKEMVKKIYQSRCSNETTK
ncbi:MAG: hypothetical protein QXG17_03360 [Sulfolobales archaeon]